MGCQKAIVSQILEQGADYVITVKANQGKLYEQVEALFKQALKKDWAGGVHTQYKKIAYIGFSTFNSTKMILESEKVTPPKI